MPKKEKRDQSQSSHQRKKRVYSNGITPKRKDISSEIPATFFFFKEGILTPSNKWSRGKRKLQDYNS